jgi:maltose alpha-D-glucosyltransferase/alpha-amylase
LLEYLKQYESTKDIGYISIPTGNHDMPRISLGRTKEELEIAYAFILTVPGVPFVYYGDEIGMPYRADLPSKEGGYNRTGARTPMQWSRGKNAGFSTGKAEDLYLPVQEDGVNVEDQLADEHSLLNTTRNLIALRKSSHALSAEGEIEFLNRRYNGYPLIYRRSGSDGSYLICINPTDREQEFSYPIQNAQVIMENNRVLLDVNGIRLAPVSYAIIKL